MFESAPEMIRWLAARVGDAGNTLQSGRAGVASVPRSAFGDTTGGTACAAATQHAVDSVGTASGRLLQALKSDVDRLRQVADDYERTDGASAQQVDSIDVYTTHVTGGHPDQINGAWDVVGQSEGRPTVLTGDFNTRLDGGGDRESREALGRHDDLGFDDAGAGAGPTDKHGHRIDYVFTNGVTPVGTEVIDGGPSDHDGLVTELVVPNNDPWAGED